MDSYREVHYNIAEQEVRHYSCKSQTDNYLLGYLKKKFIDFVIHWKYTLYASLELSQSPQREREIWNILILTCEKAV